MMPSVFELTQLCGGGRGWHPRLNPHHPNGDKRDAMSILRQNRGKSGNPGQRG